jgi:hypothetical protein
MSLALLQAFHPDAI